MWMLSEPQVSPPLSDPAAGSRQQPPPPPLRGARANAEKSSSSRQPRGLPLRLIETAARAHDRAVRVAMAAIHDPAFVLQPRTPPPGYDPLVEGDWPRYLADYPESDLPNRWEQAYKQIELPMAAGGHSLRAWGRYAHAAYVGQWSLTVRSAQCDGGTFYPVLNTVLKQARAVKVGIVAGGADVLPIARDLELAWSSSINASQGAAALWPGTQAVSTADTSASARRGARRCGRRRRGRRCCITARADSVRPPSPESP
jgi:hypothetical protein